MGACEKGSLEVVQALVAAKADLNAKDSVSAAGVTGDGGPAVR